MRSRRITHLASHLLPVPGIVAISVSSSSNTSSTRSRRSNGHVACESTKYDDSWRAKRWRSLESARQAQLDQLGVSSAAINSSMLAPLSKRTGSSVRLLQWNILADGLHDDGFLVKPILADWPAGFGNVPTAGGRAPEKFQTLVQEILRARGNSDALSELKAKYTVPASNNNMRALLDWRVRFLQMQLFILAANPDVIVIEELDHYEQMADALSELGYTSRLPGAQAYAPAHIDGHTDQTADGADRFCRSLEQKGHAFLPHLASSSMQFMLKRLGLNAKIITAAEAQGVDKQVVDVQNGKKSLSRNWTIGLPGGSRPLLEAAGVDEPSSIDDMGVAIFWREDRLTPVDLRLRTYPGGGGGVVQVRLVERGSGRSMVVMGTHLSSGDSSNDEDKRMTKQVPSAVSWAKEVAATGEPFVFVADANSHPQITGTDGKSSCWRALHDTIGASVWDGYFNEDGTAKSYDGLDPPVTSNKARGPLSGQPKKIGLHAYYLIDHVFYSSPALKLQGHAYLPKRFASAELALEAVQPSLENPSDHYPVVVDLEWQ